jgi:WG containing repeat
MDASVNQEGCKVIDHPRWSAGIAVILFVFAGALCGSPDTVTAETPAPATLSKAPTPHLRFMQRDGFSEGLGQVRVNDKWGFINARGELVIRPQFDEVVPFSEGLAAVRIGNDWGFIDKTGRMVIAPTVSPEFNNKFSEGLLSVYLNGKFGYIDATGRTVIPPRFDHARPFRSGVAAVEIDGKPAYIDHHGTVVLRPNFRRADDFEEGLAPVYNRTLEHFGFIDGTGKIAIPIRFSTLHNSVSGCWMSQRFSNGRALMIDYTQNWREWGYMDRSGAGVIPLKFRYANDFENGVAVVAVGDAAFQHLTYGLIDTNGKYLVEPKFGWLGTFSEGLSAAEISEETGLNHGGYIDRSGKFAITLSYASRLGPFYDGYAAVTTPRHGSGYIDKQGNWLWKPTE